MVRSKNSIGDQMSENDILLLPFLFNQFFFFPFFVFFCYACFFFPSPIRFISPFTLSYIFLYFPFRNSFPRAEIIFYFSFFYFFIYCFLLLYFYVVFFFFFIFPNLFPFSSSSHSSFFLHLFFRLFADFLYFLSRSYFLFHFTCFIFTFSFFPAFSLVLLSSLIIAQFAFYFISHIASYFSFTTIDFPFLSL